MKKSIDEMTKGEALYELYTLGELNGEQEEAFREAERAGILGEIIQMIDEEDAKQNTSLERVQQNQKDLDVYKQYEKEGKRGRYGHLNMGSEIKKEIDIQQGYINIANELIKDNAVSEPKPEPEIPFREKFDAFREKKQAETLRGLGIGTRATAQGLGSLAGIIYDPMSWAVTSILNPILDRDTQPQVLRNKISGVLDQLGVPKPETESEKLISAFVEFAAGGLTEAGVYKAMANVLSKTAAPVSKVVLENLAAKPMTQAISAGAAGAAGEKAKQEGHGVIGQAMAQVGAGGVTGMARSMVPRKIPKDIEMSGFAKERAKDMQIDESTAALTKRTIEGAAEHKIPIYKSQLPGKEPKTQLGKTWETVKNVVPFGMGQKLAKQQEKRVNAVKNWVHQYDVKRGIDTSQKIIENLEKNYKGKLDELTKRKHDISRRIDRRSGNAAVETPNTLRAIRTEIKKLRKLGGYDNLIKEIKDFYNEARGLDFEYFDMKRQNLGEKMNKDSLSNIKDLANRVKGRIYRGIKKDMGRHLRRYGKPDDKMKWDKVFNEFTEMIDETEKTTLKTILKKGAVDTTNLESIINTKSTSVSRLLYKKLDKEGRGLVKTAIIQKAFDESTIDQKLKISSFMNNLNKKAENLGVFFSKTERKKYEGLIRALQATESAENVKNRGIYSLFYTVGLIPSLVGGHVTGQLGKVAAGIGGATAIGVVSRILENPTISKALAKIPAHMTGSVEEAAAIKRAVDLIQIEAEKVKEDPKRYDKVKKKAKKKLKKGYTGIMDTLVEEYPPF